MCSFSKCIPREKVVCVKGSAAPRLGAGTRVAAVRHTVGTLEGSWKLFKVSWLRLL